MFNALYMLLALFSVFTESMHVCNLILAHMYSMNSGLLLNSGVTDADMGRSLDAEASSRGAPLCRPDEPSPDAQSACAVTPTCAAAGGLPPPQGPAAWRPQGSGSIRPQNTG
jgi:hypothetical protein